MRNCVLASQTGECIWPCKMDGIDADPKGNCHRLVRKKIDRQTVLGSEC
jgi:hypothetical protein